MLDRLAKLGAVLGTALSISGPAKAQEVTLRFPDGSFEVSGPLVGYDGDAYRIDTRFGILTIAAETVICEGDCPTRETAPLIRLEGAPAMAEVLMPALVDAFARSLGVGSVAAPAPEGSVGLSLGTIDGRELARFEIRASSTSEGFNALVTESADIILADRAATADEILAITAVGLGDLTDRKRRRLVARHYSSRIGRSDGPKAPPPCGSSQTCAGCAAGFRVGRRLRA